ncbi:MAG: hypothetical protein JWP88_1766 [Flaviaesturariibacter sp.]|nr:hypothetical protein [Flaviaesturariibacter sp.]
MSGFFSISQRFQSISGKLLEKTVLHMSVVFFLFNLSPTRLLLCSLTPHLLT